MGALAAVVVSMSLSAREAGRVATKGTPVDVGAGPRRSARDSATPPPACGLERGSDGVSVLPRGCAAFSLRPSLRMKAETESRVLLRADGLRVVEGRVEFDVDPVPPGEPPVRIHVSAGRIVVLGTRFTVDETGRSGRVELHEGLIHFETTDGRASRVEPGESMTWTVNEDVDRLRDDSGTRPGADPSSVAESTARRPRLPRAASSARPERTDSAARPAGSGERAAAATASPPGGTTETGSTDPAALEELLERAEELRQLGAYEALAELLKEGLIAVGDGPSAEILSFELADVLVRMDAARACRHLRRHHERFPDGAYDREIRRWVRRLECRSEGR